jgi:hypothetical protein
MTAPFLARLEEEAVAANQREQAYRREAAAEIARLEAERAYVHRRMNALKDMARVAAACETGEDACRAQLTYVFKDIGWIGGSLDDLDESKKDVAERLAPVAEAVYLAVSPPPETADAPPAEHPDPVALFHAFEDWFSATRGKRFLDAYETYVDTFMYPDA